ncbi:four helix bundle protein [Flavobacterium endophyticum]|uniref:four helix bundle protein n=1 Tax=Flavobacterium endophyticum TaxID=1540163 RepID=UPI001FE6285E|nr:four helix bundle protein [Flavobacterium endophyticum]
MAIVIEEVDETLFWLEIMQEKKWMDDSELNVLWKEGNELTAIFVSTIKKIKSRLNE